MCVCVCVCAFVRVCDMGKGYRDIDFTFIPPSVKPLTLSPFIGRGYCDVQVH